MAAAVAHGMQLPELVAAAIASVSTTLPDWSEMPFYRDGKRTGSLIAHRTVTHWPPLWLVGLAVAHHEGGFPGAMLVGTAIGALTHIFGDAPNPMGIPWLLPNKRLRIGKNGWWRSGEHEPFMALLFATVGFATWRVVVT